MLQQRKFFVGEHNRPASALGVVLQAVQLQIAGAQQQPRLPFTTKQRAAAGAQFLQAEWLGHKVVGAVVQAAHPRVDFQPSRQHQNRQIGVEHAHFVQHLLAVLHRHVQIEDCQIGHLLPECLHCLAAVCGQANAMTVCFKASRQKQT
jgi:hypothetical protein